MDRYLSRGRRGGRRLSLTVADPYPHIRCSGGPRERGRQYGEQAASRVRRSIQAYEAVFDFYTGWGWPRVVSKAAEYLPAIADYDDRYVEEMRGIAEGAGVAFDDILALNVRSEVMWAGQTTSQTRTTASSDEPRAGSPHSRPECSAVVVLPAISADGHVLVAQNWDWLVHAFETTVVLEVEPDDGPAYLTVVEAGLLAKTGVNAAGIALVTNTLVSDEDDGRTGVPYHVVLRAILAARSISEAADAVLRATRSTSANYLIADRDGLCLDLECAPGDYGAVYPALPEAGAALHTNHFLSPRFHGRDAGLRYMTSSPLRLQRLKEAVAAAAPDVTATTLTTVFCDHANHPNGVCNHPDPADPPVDQGATVASVVYDLTGATMLIADGLPCETGYRRVDLDPLFGRSRA